MVHSVELICDAATDVAVRDIWLELADNGVRSQASHRSPSNRPHTTLTVGAELSRAADTDLAALLPRLPQACRLGAPMVFGRGPFTLVLLVVPSAELLDLHAAVHRICLPHMSSDPLPHTAPGQWTPHVTLARRIDADALGRALTVVSPLTEIGGRFSGLRHWDGDAREEHPIV